MKCRGDQCVVLGDIGWDGYSKLLKIRGERSVPRMIYLDGSVLLMSPSFPHERFKQRLGIFIVEVVAGLKIPCVPAGSTTFRRRAKRGGVEGDQTFYLANEAKVRGKEALRLKVDPPPDLAIEVVWTHDAAAATEVYRRFKVPEVWIYGHDELTILYFNPAEITPGPSKVLRCRCLPPPRSLPGSGRPQSETETVWILDLRRWVAEVLAPRHRQR